MTQFHLAFYLSTSTSSKKKIPGQKQSISEKNLQVLENKPWSREVENQPVIFSSESDRTLFHFQLENEEKCISKGIHCNAIQEGSVQVKHRTLPHRSFNFGVNVSVGRQRVSLVYY